MNRNIRRMVERACEIEGATIISASRTGKHDRVVIRTSGGVEFTDTVATSPRSDNLTAWVRQAIRRAEARTRSDVTI